MAIQVAIRHKTTYTYDRLVGLSPHVFRLRPAVHSRTSIEAYSFKILPELHFINWQQDPFGNFLARVVFPEKTKLLEIDVEVIANLQVINPFDFFVEDYAAKFPFAYPAHLAKELAPFLESYDQGPNFYAWLHKHIDISKAFPIVDFLVLINQQLNRDIAYSVRMEVGVQDPEDTLQKAVGSCRDSAWLLVHLLRHLGLAARFVSGYLVQLKADEKSLDGPSGTAVDFTDLHAWAEVYIPGAGWIGMDPTSGLFAGEGHIPLACAPDYVSAAPVVGSSDECNVQFSFNNTVTRIREDPRVTMPFTEDQWAQINAIGLQVDNVLKDEDVRLTMGGEPTFVSIDDMESAQWNTAADGLEKRILSHDLIYRLREKFGPSGLIHYGQGKWYPGEPLPRWQYGLFWRKDGYPVWKNLDLIAHENCKDRYTYHEAARFATDLAKCLAVDAENICPAYEDAFYFLWTEGKNPVNIDPLKANLKDSLERRRLAALLNQGLGDPVGFVLPLQWDHQNDQWRSSKWLFNQEHMFLVPGNSPIGLRLPLKSLPEDIKAKRQEEPERSLFEPVSPLDHFHETISARYGSKSVLEEPGQVPYRQQMGIANSIAMESSRVRKTNMGSSNESEIESGVHIVKTALSVEIREGMIYIFIPPIHYIEHYLDLVASIESAASNLNMQIRIEGYEPPRDNRIVRLVVSPDPGVIEVNIHPAKTWNELCHVVDTLYEQARLSRLGTEKFMQDGRHTGTGGGNHITIGGEKPEDSPLLRRPDLLRSLITFWQHHPGLSYLFSGPFVGPTSQAPRIDEGFEDRLYEMEIAFNQVPERGFIPFWIVDRIFRHLLTDITGNTHRSEFCIDKLYSPDSSSGQLGILEFRAFDMPPHKRMSLLQMLLIRALIAAFWKKPYKHKLVRWGTALYDKYLLPQYVKEDMSDVVDYLKDAGYDFEISWFDPFFEFRFPHFGSVSLKGIDMELRMGIEPWHVLGEEMSNSGTSRFVDSSLEKIQVKLNGINDSRYILLCNSMRVPLTPTGLKGEYVCGVRYRAWQPPSSLHPTIGVDTPLTFDIVDTWNGRSIGGCTYYVSHPGGRSYDTFPVNSYEAESRRISRFGNTSHTQETMFIKSPVREGGHFVESNREPFVFDAPIPEISNEFPCTLDLRLKKGLL